MITALLPCVLLLLLLILIYCRKRVDLPPPAGGALPIIGHAWLGFIKRERLFDVVVESVLRPSLERGEDTVCFKVGSLKVYVCLDPDDGYLLSNSCLNKDPTYKLFNPAIGGDDGLISSVVPTWKIHRKLLNPTFNQSVLDTYLTVFNERSQQLVKLLAEEVGKGYFDPLSYLKLSLLETVCATMMGVSVDDDKSLIEEYGDAADTYSKCMVAQVIHFYYHIELIFKWSNLKKKMDAAAKCINNLSYEVIKNRKEKISAQEDKGTDTSTSPPRFKSFLDLLLEMGKDGALTESEIQQQVNTFIGAAYDTTTHSLGFVLLVIGSYPEVQEKIFDELQEVLKGSARDVERQDVSKLKYLDAVIKETMRLYPVAVTVGRKLETDLKLKKYTLPAGSRCFMSIYHAGRHRMWGADAGQFRPERWLDGSLPANTRAYAVFGLGRRSCIGSNFALMLMKTVLCHVVRRYRISGDVTRLVQNFTVIVTPVSGHHIMIEQRNQ